MSTTTQPAAQDVNEPILEMEDIQGIAIPGFLKPQQVLLYVRVPAAALEGFQYFLRNFGPSTAADALQDRRAHRDGVKSTETVLKAVGLSFAGLKRLVPDASSIASPAFRLGLTRRSALLGDPTELRNPGHPANWDVGGSARELDALFVFAGDLPDKVQANANAVQAEMENFGAHVEHQVGAVRSDLSGHEHFGFDDGVSQPGIRGLASSAPGDYVTPRYIDPAQAPREALLYGYPGQSLVWPGEFVFGYPASSPDPLLPGPASVGGPAWMRNGSYLVFRKLYQDVALFWNEMNALRTDPDKGLEAKLPSDVDLASRLVGRWPSGAPLSRSKDGDNGKLGDDPFENNNFLFDADTPDLAYLHKDGRSHGTDYPQEMASSDPIGLTCPLSAHIRKVNTRDSSSDMGATLASYARRILRVGVPYGPPIRDNYEDDGVDRGLLFLSIQSSIEEQFEFLQARWMNDPSRPKAPSGNDMIVGQNEPAGGVRTCVFFPTIGLEPTSLETTKQWVQPRGGGYFFLPSLTALKTVVGGTSTTLSKT